jgi:hypothetical protein
VQTDAERYLETLRRQLQGTQDLTLTETVLAEIRGGSLRNASASEQRRALALASEIEGTREVIRLARERSDQRNAENAEIDKFVAAQKAANEERVRSILSATPTAQLNAALADIKLIGQEFDAGRISAEQWAEAVKGISAPLAAAGEEVQKLGTFAEQAGRNIQDALGETIKDTLKGDFDSIGDLWRDLLINMAAEAAAARLNDALFGGIFGGGGQGGGLLGRHPNRLPWTARPATGGGASSRATPRPCVHRMRARATVWAQGVMSAPRNRKPSSTAALPVLPEPRNGSSTSPPGGVTSRHR